MKCIGFIGKADKTELVGYIAKIIASTAKKVILLDATANQKTRYTIPTIEGMDQETLGFSGRNKSPDRYAI